MEYLSGTQIPITKTANNYIVNGLNTLFNAENSVQRNDGRDYKLKQLANDGICSKRYI